MKRCPTCHVPIERDSGCAQMMCKRCKHVFCWYCLASLDVSSQVTIWLLVLCRCIDCCEFGLVIWICRGDMKPAISVAAVNDGTH